MINVDDYYWLRFIMWSCPTVKQVTRKEAHERYASTWEYVFLRGLEDHEIELINSLINEFGPIVPRYRTFQTYGNRRPYTSGRPITHLFPLTTPTTVKVVDYPQLHKSALQHGFREPEITRNDAFLWYTEHWFDIDLGAMQESERDFINELIFEFGPILPSLALDSEKVGKPIIRV